MERSKKEKTTKKQKVNVYELVTQAIIKQLKQGIIPWERPWVGIESCSNYVSGHRYSLLNQMLLPYSGEYATYQQWQSVGGQVRRGCKGSTIVFWSMWLRKIDKQTGKPATANTPEDDIVTQPIPILKYHTVFHISQVDGVESKLKEIELPNVVKDDRKAERIIGNYINREGIVVTREFQMKSAYSLNSDKVILPLKEQFKSTEEYYSTVFHELVHSTGHKTRLNREYGYKFGDKKYSREELVAEIGSAMLCKECGMFNKTKKNSAAYIKSWLSRLEEDTNLVVAAGGQAQKAVEFILGQ